MTSLASEPKMTSAAELTESLRKAIQHGEFLPGTSIPSERQLGEESGLSRMTVRRAIEVLVEEGVLYRVPGAGTFVGQRSESAGLQNALGLIVPSLANAFYAEFADVIAQEAYQHGYQLMLGRSEFNWISEAEMLNQYASNPAVKGILIAPTSGMQRNTQVYSKLNLNNTPYLFIVRKPGELDGDSVMTDHVGGAMLSVNHLIELGHRQIAYIGALRSEPNRHMVGYRQALQEAGIAEDPDLMISIDAGAEEAGLCGVRELLSRNKPFTAVFARIDNTAVGVLQGLREAGIRVPEDVSLTSFDNTEVVRHLQPPLTSVDHTKAELGRLAVLMLLDRVEGRYNGPFRHLVISPTLVKRASTAPPRTT